ncbi:MAG: UTP--glucose-1-phosphate uridylyltransferase [Pseudomonadota bacterium]
MTSRIRKAVFPVAGSGTRMLPATRAIPKEMLTIVDKPLIQYAVEEARDAGVEQFIFVTGKGKSAIEDHFDDAGLQELGLKPGQVSYTTQTQPLGLGHAIWCARYLVADEPFAIVLVDELLSSDRPCLKQMLENFAETPDNYLALMQVPREQTHRYGIVKTTDANDARIAIQDMVEKPASEVAPSNWAIIGRYLLTPEVFSYLERQKPGAGNEIQLTDAMRAMLVEHRFQGIPFQGDRFDCGSKVGWLQANMHMASLRDDLRDELGQSVPGRLVSGF